MKFISSEKTYIDYFNNVFASRRGLRNRFGIRVFQDCCLVVVQMGDELPFVFGKEYPLPVEPESAPSHVRMIIDNYQLNFPGSDLNDVLAKRKSFREAVDSNTKIKAKRESRAPRSRA